ncbi:mucin-5AC [Drosophila rhopaloa]|uniref:Mucin-5AC n=1 Tax=Drosophila rhopaloa TaxID=1041015 RepID=A0A6P4FLE5_DRORH|nr:mucin-5AC [Drosophila rhopaloa]
MSPNRIGLPLSLVLLVACLVSSTRGTCNVCNAVNNLTCYSSTQMQACQVGVLSTATPTACPSGYVCASGSSGVLCQPQDASGGGQADCQECNKCDASQTFACTGSQSFALCLGTDTVQDSVGTCASGYVCNINDTQICGLPANGVMPTCSYTDDTTTSTTSSTTSTTTTPGTPSTSSASAYCAAVQSQGKYAVGYNAYTTCRQYIYCTLVSGSWIGETYTCPGTLFFDSASGMCESDMPSTCSTTATTPSTTTAAPTTSNPGAYCRAMQSAGYYPVGTDASTTCRRYIDCFLLNGSWNGNMYQCPGSMYYNSASKMCDTTLPATCSTTVASLSLNGVDLD